MASRAKHLSRKRREKKKRKKKFFFFSCRILSRPLSSIVDPCDALLLSHRIPVASYLEVLSHRRLHPVAVGKHSSIETRASGLDAWGQRCSSSDRHRISALHRCLKRRAGGFAAPVAKSFFSRADALQSGKHLIPCLRKHRARRCLRSIDALR